MTGLNFIVTIHRLRAPGMTWFRLPLFIWSYYATSIIFVLATPVIAITLVLVMLERIFGIGVFDPAMGGDPLLFQHLFWFYSHPAVYVMILPGMGVISEVIACFSKKAGLWVYRSCLLLRRDRRLQLLCLGAPHVHHGHIELFRAGILLVHHAGRRAFRDQDLQLVGDDV